MVKLNNFYYNFRVVIMDNDKKVLDKLYSQLKEIMVDLPQLTMTEIKYLSNYNSSFSRNNPKFKGISIQKITPIFKY